ncbi:MAG TPA: tetratricopeptide repeat protein, partial [Solirubrobacterales bacterium]|nr:tetratricopeptide repeat protein [Solirubrobacterales bacterium]
MGHPSFADGVRFVDLSAASGADGVISATARALGARATASPDAREALHAFVATGHLLVVFDNFEHVLAAAPDIGGLIGAGRHLTCLVTSRESLRLRWERTLPVLPLGLPDPRHLPPLDRLGRIPAVALFVEKARAAHPAFTLDESNASAVAELCVRLDGLPLAIELVAARAGQLGPRATLDRLVRRLPVDAAGWRDAPARQRSLKATLDWSLELLRPNERTLFARLGVFAGGCDLAAAEAIAETSDDTFGTLMTLADRSLLQIRPAVDQEVGSEPRFLMLDTARSHALELLGSTGTLDEVHLRHARHYADVAEQAARILQGPDQALVVRELEREEDNFRIALEWARSNGRADAIEAGLRLVGALAWYWFLHGYPAEARSWFETLLTVEPDRHDDVGRMAVLQAKALNAAGFRATDQGEYALGRTYHERALATWRRLGEVPGLVTSLHGIGDTALWLGESAAARQSYEEGRALAAAEGTSEDVALFAFHLGQLSWLEDRLTDAAAFAQEALDVARAAGSTTWPPYAMFILASVAHERGDVATAGATYREGISLAWEHHDRLGVRMALPGLAALAGPEGDPARAVKLAGAAHALERNAGIWAFPPIRERHDRWLRAAEAGVSPAAWDEAWQAGLQLSIAEAIDYALEPATTASKGARDRLSPREREVLELIAQG